MNILHLHTGLNLTCGISKTIYLIAKYPSEKKNHFVISLNGDAREKFSESGINVTFLNIKKNSIFGIFKIINSIKRFIEKYNIDIVHSHHRFFDFISYLISFTTKVKRITSVQSFVYGKKIFSYKSPLLLAAGESVKKHLINYFKIEKERVIVFNNFIDIEEKPENIKTKIIKEEFCIADDSYVIGYAGRFSIREKGIDILIEAYREFNKENPNSYLIMVGEGEDINKIKVQKNVKIVSAKKNIFDYYSIFDCLILPSRVDPFPLAVLEAGMMKVPFIGAEVNGISEIISNNTDGLLFEKENVNMLKEKMETLFKDRNLALRCAENLHKKVINNYEKKKALDLLNKIYEKP